MRASRCRLAEEVDWKRWATQVRAGTPELVRVGRKPPAAVLSFGGCGGLVAYSLGVAQFLQREKAEFLQQCFLLGAGSGVIPAVALACGPQHASLQAIMDYLCTRGGVSMTNELVRRPVVQEGLERLLPGGPDSTSAKDPVALVSGRVALAISFSPMDSGYRKQRRANVLFGHHIATWSNREDLVSCMAAAMCPNRHHPMTFRGEPTVLRATWYSMSSELDQSIRHVHVHGYTGRAHNRHHTRHNFMFGRHGFLANTHDPYWQQALLAFFPDVLALYSDSRRVDRLRRAFEQGHDDARRYERWEEDPYHYAKPDRCQTDTMGWSSLRRAIFGGRAVDRFDL